MPQIDEIKKSRVEKLKAMQRAGVDVFPLTTKRTHFICDSLKDFAKLERAKKEIILTGRIKSFRGHGGATFSDIEDGTDKIQLFFKKDNLGPKRYELLQKYFDIGDFIEARGVLFKTKLKEKTLLVNDFKILAK